ncbi:MAG TPA: type VI secretion system baseplate subunit TssG [Gemmataceae bacterium]|nr:type VI secretion system baseplate subunit TssG [Gemmataceae bacterium]
MAAAFRGTTTSVDEVGAASRAASEVRLGSLDLRAPSAGVPTLEERLFAEGYAFDFFQAVRLLERLAPDRRPVGRDAPPQMEIARFRAHVSLSFPPSSIVSIESSGEEMPPILTVAFLGLIGPSGVLPNHYTELLLRQQIYAKGPERHALRDWLDLFNHRFLALFHRAWEKYRFPLAFERGEHLRGEPDAFTRCLFSFIGLGMPPLRDRLRVTCREIGKSAESERVLASVEDLVLLHYSGLLVQRPRNAVSLEALLQDYFQHPVRVRQFQGQWLRLETDNQSRLGAGQHNNRLGIDCVAGERVWDVQSKFRVRLGPLTYADFVEFLPDRTATPRRKAIFLLMQLVRLYAGPELDFDVQLLLKADEVPLCRLSEPDGIGPRLGWNTWLRSLPFTEDAEDAVFEGECEMQNAECRMQN